MGFGHRVYKTGDPRARILKEYCTRLAAEIGEDRWERIAEPIEQAVTIFLLQLADLRADRRLRTENLFSRAREAALSGDFQKCDELIEVHLS